MTCHRRRLVMKKQKIWGETKLCCRTQNGARHWEMSTELTPVIRWLWLRHLFVGRYFFSVISACIPVKAHIGPDGCRNLRLQEFSVGTWRWQAYGHLYPPGTPLVLISVRGWVHRRAVVGPEGLSQWEIWKNTSGNEPATFRLVP
jgi:hypothetical protein